MTNDTPNGSGNGSGDAPETASENPQAALEVARAEAVILKEELLRALAEADNVRKRSERALAEERQFGNSRFARDLLSVSDNLRRALESVPAASREHDAVKALMVGVELTERELASVFERHNVRRISPLGEKFNPHFHQAIARVPGSGRPAGTIIDVVQIGYLIADRLLRPAMVAVAEGDVRTPAPGSSTGFPPGSTPGSTIDTKA